jgi:ribosomal protein L10
VSYLFTVNLSAKVTANPRERKEKLVDNIQNAVDEYERVFVFEFDNMRSNFFKQLRVEWGKSR